MAEGDPFRGVVTATTVYGAVVEVGGQVAKIDGKVDRIDDKVSGLVTRVDDHEGRIRTLETARWPHGKLTLMLAAAGLVVAILSLVAKGAG
ncbi:hypothetical protein [Nonomuraea sp. NEAU-A123]|uniref:hypothetical protein n=1 Tax=Nonomuraea sp. NEAU-A123 TaxID=2839649 RepID=UPI001BE48EE2|nr:hypothetical protein [Nonomuraea sp. NEAU-A123]MBT2226235.1 hypothetical protein [Nonomuraea sp. NEAU-A123]